VIFNGVGYLVIKQLRGELLLPFFLAEININMRSYEFITESKLDVKTLTVSQLADLHAVPEQEIIDQLNKGIRVELEHTTDRRVAREIALDHLKEFPDYYDRLAKAEKSK
jgi:hypothetical protein